MKANDQEQKQLSWRIHASRKSTGHTVVTKLLLPQIPDPLQMVVSVKKIHSDLWKDKLGEREFIVCVLTGLWIRIQFLRIWIQQLLSLVVKIIKDCSEIRNNWVYANIL